VHRPDQFPAAEGFIAGKLNLADFDLRPLIDFENENDGVAGSDAFVLRGFTIVQ